jgi:hypothetical protein
MVAMLAPAPPSRAELLRRRRALEQRLIDGWKRIDAAIADGRDVAEWERHWMLLLGEYQRVCAALRAAGGVKRRPGGAARVAASLV